MIVSMEVERYSPELKAQFLLSNAIDEADYLQAEEAVRELGLDPELIPHVSPPR